MRSISFCTAIRNRLHHLKQTLPKNIEDNEGYPKLEFVILDYTSNDGLEQWMNSEMAHHLISGRVVYIPSTGHPYFERSRSRNMAFNAAKGELVCNIDADNFTGEGFAAYIDKAFAADENIFLTAFSDEQPSAPDLFGRICCRKQDFLKVGGYNEQMEGYGFEDHELILKLTKAGLTRRAITGSNFFNAITHSDEERLREEKPFRSLKDIYLSFISPSRTDILYLFTDGKSARGQITDRTTDNCTSPAAVLHLKKFRYEYTLATPEWYPGTWYKNDNSLYLTDNAGNTETLTINRQQLNGNAVTFCKVEEKNLLTDLLMFYTQFNNRRFLNDDKIETITPQPASKPDAHRIFTSSVYWPAANRHELLREILAPALVRLNNEDKNAFGIVRLNNHRGANINITWFMPCQRAEELLHMVDTLLKPQTGNHAYQPTDVTQRGHSTFMDFPAGQLAYGLYQYPTVTVDAISPPAFIFLSRQLNHIIFEVFSPEPIDQDTTFTLAFYLHALMMLPLGPLGAEINLETTNTLPQNHQLANVLTENAAMFAEIISDISSPEFLMAEENRWMKNWQDACAAIIRDFSTRPAAVLQDISNLIIDTLGLPKQAAGLIYTSINTSKPGRVK